MSVYPNTIEMIFYPCWKYLMWIKILDELAHFLVRKKLDAALLHTLKRRSLQVTVYAIIWVPSPTCSTIFPIRCVVQIFFHQMHKLISLLNNFWNLAFICNIGERNAFHNAVNIFQKWWNKYADNCQFVCDVGAFNALLVIIILLVLLQLSKVLLFKLYPVNYSYLN